MYENFANFSERTCLTYSRGPQKDIHRLKNNKNNLDDNNVDCFNIRIE